MSSILGHFSVSNLFWLCLFRSCEYCLGLNSALHCQLWSCLSLDF